MPVSEELTAEVDAAIDVVVESQKPDLVKQVESDNEPSDESEEELKDEPEDESKDKPEDNSEDKPEDEVAVDSEDDPSEDSSEKPDKKSELTPVVVSDVTLAAAVMAGIDLGVARQFPSELSLQQAVASIDAAKEANKPEEEEADPFKDIPKMNPEEFEPEVIKMYDALVDVVKKQHEELKELKTQTADYTKQSVTVNQEATEREMTSWFDSQVSELGKDFQEALGKGGIDSLNPGSSQYAKRNEIANRIAVSLAGYNAARIQAPPREELFQEAAGLILKKEYQQVSEKKLIADLKKQGSQHINRANSKNTKQSQNPMDETAAMLDKRFNLK